jgi:hypothetical protein
MFRILLTLREQLVRFVVPWMPWQPYGMSDAHVRAVGRSGRSVARSERVTNLLSFHLPTGVFGAFASTRGREAGGFGVGLGEFDVEVAAGASGLPIADQSVALGVDTAALGQGLLDAGYTESPGDDGMTLYRPGDATSGGFGPGTSSIALDRERGIAVAVSPDGGSAERIFANADHDTGSSILDDADVVELLDATGAFQFLTALEIDRDSDEYPTIRWLGVSSLFTEDGFAIETLAMVYGAEDDAERAQLQLTDDVAEDEALEDLIGDATISVRGRVLLLRLGSLDESVFALRILREDAEFPPLSSWQRDS